MTHTMSHDCEVHACVSTTTVQCITVCILTLLAVVSLCKHYVKYYHRKSLRQKISFLC